MSETVKKAIYRVESIRNSQLKYVYPLAKMLLLPSKEEIFGMVLLEAIYFGIPVITSFNGGSVTLLQNRQAGQIVDLTESKWAIAIAKYLQGKSYCNEVIQNARNVLDEYNWDVIAKKILSFF